MRILKEIYNKLLKHFGQQHWWPGESQLEIIIGAILTQNTNWLNVEKAIKNLKQANLLSINALDKMEVDKIAQFIKPAGYYNIKAKRLKNFINWLSKEYNADITQLESKSTDDLREELLGINGIGMETADSIVLYAFNKLSFVVDAYTYSIFSRHNLIPEETDYYEIKSFFEDNLTDDCNLFNEYHALIVRLGKECCKKTKPLCEKCPLNGINNYP